MIESITRPHVITKMKILNLLKGSSKTINEISEVLGLNQNLVYCHLHGWKRKNRKSNQGLIDSGAVIFKKTGRINNYILKKVKDKNKKSSNKNI